MSKQSAPGSLPSAEHVFKDGVEGKICRGRYSRSPEHWCALDGYWNCVPYADGKDETCIACRKLHRREREATDDDRSMMRFDKTSTALIPYNEVEHIGVTIGWVGAVKYWPVRPLLALTKVSDWSNFLKELKSDPLLGTTMVNITTVGAQDGKQRGLVCIPWSHWHSFWLKFGNERTKDVQQDAQRILAFAFGDTAEQVKGNTERVRSNGVLSLDLDTLRKRDVITALWGADDAVEQARREAMADRDRAQRLREEAEQLERQAQEHKATARRAEQEAQARIDEAARQQAAIEMEIERLLNGNVEYTYVWHSSQRCITPLWVDGKFGAIPSGNVKQKRKQLRAGAEPGADFAVLRPTDNCVRAEKAERKYCSYFGLVEGNDKFVQLERVRYDRLIAAMEEHEYIEAEWLEHWVEHEIAAAMRYA